MRFGIIIQARTSSTRLPAKVLKKLPENGGRTVLEHVTGRCLKTSADEVIIATTTEAADKAIYDAAAKIGARAFRGSENDVLGRYYLAAKESGLDAVMRITSDCPCHDPALLDSMITRFKESSTDYLSNTLTRTYPHGLDAELFTFAALEKAYEEAELKPYREHVTPYLYKSGLFKTEQFTQSSDTSHLRVTLDTPEDYALLCAVFSFLGDDFGLSELEKLYADNPWLSLINKTVVQKKIFTSLDEEILEAVRLLEKQDMLNAANILKQAEK